MKRLTRVPRAAMASVGIVLLLGCGGDPVPMEPEPMEAFDFSGTWDYTEVLTIATRPPVVCADSGTFVWTAVTGGIDGTAEQVGRCATGATPLGGGLANNGSFDINNGQVTGDSAIEFTRVFAPASSPTGVILEFCLYGGALIERSPARVTGDVQCFSPTGGFSGTWEARQDPAVVSMRIEPDTMTLVVGGAAQLSAAVLNEFGTPAFQRGIMWTSSNPAAVTVDNTGAVTAAGPGQSTVSATTAGQRDEVTVVVEVLRFTAVASGGLHTCGLTEVGSAACWGLNHFSQLGLGVNIAPQCPVGAPCLDTPGFVAGGHRFADLASGFAHTCGVTTAGELYCWGNNETGAVGDGTISSRASPVLVSTGGQTFSSVTAGFFHSCALDVDGGTHCWGLNTTGQLGDGTLTTRTEPVAVQGGLAFASISAGANHTCGLQADGSAYCWGDNGAGRVGDGTEVTRTEPAAVGGGLRFIVVNAGEFHSCGVGADGLAYCWGRNADGYLGDGTRIDRLLPVPVDGGRTFVDITAGNLHTCGITDDASAWCWGWNFPDGRLGNGTSEQALVPVQVTGGLSFASVVAGGGHTCGMTTGAELWCWGSDASGQLGNGPVVQFSSLVPSRVFGQ